MSYNTDLGIPGITGITGFVSQDPEATPEEMHGGPADPKHGQWGEAARPYSWESQLTGFTGSHGPYDAPYTNGEFVTVLTAGNLSQDPQSDLNPSPGQVGGSHAAPITRPLSGPLPSMADSINLQTVQSRDQHASNLGASRIMQSSQDGLSVQQDNWVENWTVDMAGTTLQTNVPAQVAGGFMFGTRDRAQSLAQQNEYGFDAPHLHRRTAQGSIPGNYMWMKPGSRPLVKTVPKTARPAVGYDSPFYGDDPMQTFGIQGAVLMNTPTEYTAPPQPNVVSSVPDTNPAAEIALW